jgi:hypothetical protein
MTNSSTRPRRLSAARRPRPSRTLPTNERFSPLPDNGVSCKWAMRILGYRKLKIREEDS